MALKINYDLVVPYVLTRFDSKEIYANILTDNQIENLPFSIEKTFLIENVYCKIESLNGNKEKIDIQLEIYKDESKQTLIARKPYSFTPDLESADNFIKQGYKDLKINLYPNAIDILETGQTL